MPKKTMQKDILVDPWRASAYIGEDLREECDNLARSHKPLPGRASWPGLRWWRWWWWWWWWWWGWWRGWWWGWWRWERGGGINDSAVQPQMAAWSPKTVPIVVALTPHHWAGAMANTNTKINGDKKYSSNNNIVLLPQETLQSCLFFYLCIFSCFLAKSC